MGFPVPLVNTQSKYIESFEQFSIMLREITELNQSSRCGSLYVVNTCTSTPTSSLETASATLHQGTKRRELSSPGS